jgi:hypothetical protein
VNNRSGDASISKRLDHFFIHHRVLEFLCNYRSWIKTYQISDHFLILLELSIGTTKPKVPFKYIPTSDAEEDFKLVVDSWKGTESFEHVEYSESDLFFP